MDAALQQAVRDRAKHRCEYCHFPAEFAELPFHHDHVFSWNGPVLVGKTPTGRATIRALRLNRSDAVAVRQLLMQERVYPTGS